MEDRPLLEAVDMHQVLARRMCRLHEGRVGRQVLAHAQPGRAFAVAHHDKHGVRHPLVRAFHLVDSPCVQHVGEVRTRRQLAAGARVERPHVGAELRNRLQVLLAYLHIVDILIIPRLRWHRVHRSEAVRPHILQQPEQLGSAHRVHAIAGELLAGCGVGGGLRLLAGGLSHRRARHGYVIIVYVVHVIELGTPSPQFHLLPEALVIFLVVVKADALVELAS
mmetsp:Transcript_7376/g.14765  ORF Transcript_7376/g.14765 Transcript_7376/m.14765 type:complete len:222 (+) Transcript_7376:373-1038(+)